MKLQLQFLILLGLITLALSLTQREPVAHDDEIVEYNYQKGCWKNQCWSYCSGAKSWCYTKKCVWKGCDGRISCSGGTYDDDSCPYYTYDNFDTNCDSTCFWF